MDIWRKPPYLPYVQPELTDEAVREAERALGVKLPREYIELLKIQNGGYIAYTLPESAAVNAVHDGIAGIGPNYPSLVENADWGYDDDINERLEGLIPFDGDGHWYLCLDYRENRGEPAITFIEMDDVVDAKEGYAKVVAKNFAQYLALLVKDEGA